MLEKTMTFNYGGSQPTKFRFVCYLWVNKNAKILPLRHHVQSTNTGCVAPSQARSLWYLGKRFRGPDTMGTMILSLWICILVASALLLTVNGIWSRNTNWWVISVDELSMRWHVKPCVIYSFSLDSSNLSAMTTNQIHECSEWTINNQKWSQK